MEKLACPDYSKYFNGDVMFWHQSLKCSKNVYLHILVVHSHPHRESYYDDSLKTFESVLLTTKEIIFIWTVHNMQLRITTIPLLKDFVHENPQLTFVSKYRPTTIIITIINMQISSIIHEVVTQLTKYFHIYRTLEVMTRT